MLWILGLALAGDCAVVDGVQLVVPTPFSFATRSAELSDDAPVEAVKCALDEDPARTVQIEVHTDSRGSGTYNQRMSQERADAIRVALLDLGVAPERVTAVGYGETMPASTNQSAEGRATNRRIELHLAPPSERPVAPEALPAPVRAARAEPASPSLCDELDAALGKNQAREWRMSGPSVLWVSEAKRCLSPAWDVDDQPTSLYAYRSGWQLTVGQQGESVFIQLRPR